MCGRKYWMPPSSGSGATASRRLPLTRLRPTQVSAKAQSIFILTAKKRLALPSFRNINGGGLEEVARIAQDPNKSPVQKLTEMLQYPILYACQSCREAPGMQEMITAIKPHIRRHIQPQTEQEYEMVAGVLEEGNRLGVFDVPDTLGAAKTLKMMTMGFMPPYPSVSEPDEVEAEIAAIVALAVRGLRKT